MIKKDTIKKDAMKKSLRKIWVGKVVSDKNNQTIIVEVNKIKTHPIYKKKYSTSKRYQVHDPDNSFKIGQRVEFIECRPISKTKHHQVCGVIT